MHTGLHGQAFLHFMANIIQLIKTDKLFLLKVKQSVVVIIVSQAKFLQQQKLQNILYEKIVRANSWNPKEYMETPLASPSNVNLSGNTLTWDAVSGAAGYLIFMNGNYAGQTTDTTVTLTNIDESNIYTVKTVSQYGTVSE